MERIKVLEIKDEIFEVTNGLDLDTQNIVIGLKDNSGNHQGIVSVKAEKSRIRISIVTDSSETGIKQTTKERFHKTFLIK